jgi:hypothetical protein
LSLKIDYIVVHKQDFMPGFISKVKCHVVHSKVNYRLLVYYYYLTRGGQSAILTADDELLPGS